MPTQGILRLQHGCLLAPLLFLVRYVVHSGTQYSGFSSGSGPDPFPLSPGLHDILPQ